MLAYRRLGISKPPVESMIATIQGMKYYIRKAFGDSELALDGSGNVKPFQGILQGNGTSPTTCVIISSSLLNMLRAAGNGGYFVEAISGKISHSVGYVFVDDKDLN